MAPASLHFYECGPQTKNLNTRDLKKTTQIRHEVKRCFSSHHSIPHSVFQVQLSNAKMDPLQRRAKPSGGTVTSNATHSMATSLGRPCANPILLKSRRCIQQIKTV